MIGSGVYKNKSQAIKMNIYKLISGQIKQSLQDIPELAGVSDSAWDGVVVEVPKNRDFGDFSTNVAMVLTRELFPFDQWLQPKYRLNNMIRSKMNHRTEQIIDNFPLLARLNHHRQYLKKYHVAQS